MGWSPTIYSGQLATSADTLSWSSSTGADFVRPMTVVKYGGDRWVAAGFEGLLFTSLIGATWLPRTSGFGGSVIRDLAYGNGVWIAVGDGGKMARSTDNGETWTLVTSSFGSTPIHGIAYGNGLWVAVGGAGKIATSSDGGTWTQRANVFGASPIWCVAYGNGLWVAAGSHGKLASSANATSWTMRISILPQANPYIEDGQSGYIANPEKTEYIFTGVAYADGVWIAAAGTHYSRKVLDPDSGFLSDGWVTEILPCLLADSANGTSWNHKVGPAQMIATAPGLTVSGTMWGLTGDQGRLAFSTAPTYNATWQFQNSGFTDEINAIAHNGSNLWVTCGVGKSFRVSDNARSNSIFRCIDLVSEGKIKGLVRKSDDPKGLRSMFIGGTPLMSKAGKLNFEGIDVVERLGTPDQAPIPGVPAAETPFDVGVEVTQSIGVVTRTINNLNVDSVYLLFSFPSLYRQSDKGEMKAAHVEFTIEITGQPAQTKKISATSRSTYEVGYRLPLLGDGPWDIKVTRITADSEVATTTDKFFWSSYTEIIEHQLRFPDSALFGVTANAELFGGKSLVRSYLLEGREIRVPTGYTPPYKNEAGVWQPAVYPAFWDGTFQEEVYTSCPAWVFLDMVTHTRYGAGVTDISKWALYPISKYCDELISDGRGGVEPRFTINCVLKGQQDAYTLINTLAAAFRGMAWWSAGSIVATQDSPAAVSLNATPANVFEGRFTYASPSLKAQHTVCLVTWSNPANNYAPEIEPVEDEAGIARHGYRPIEIAPIGVTSRALAHRFGRWLLYSEEAETEVVSYTAGLDHVFARPGMITQVADPFRAEVRMGGRLAAVSGTSLTLDAEVTLVAGETYKITCTLGDPDAGGNPKVEQRTITTASGGAATKNLTINSAFSAAPAKGSVWVITGTDVAPQLFRIASVKPREGYFDIVAAKHDPNKFAMIEQALKFDPIPVARELPPPRVPAPGNPRLSMHTLATPEGPRFALLFEWDEVGGALQYEVSYQIGRDGDWLRLGATQDTHLTHRVAAEDHYYFGVRAVTPKGTGEWATAELTVDISSVIPAVTNLRLVDGDSASTFSGGTAKFAWDPTSISDLASIGGTDPWFQSYIVQIYKGANLVHTAYPVTPEFAYTYEQNVLDGGASRSFTAKVAQRNNRGDLGVFTELAVSNPASTMAGFTPVIETALNGLKVSWAQFAPTDLDLAGFSILLDTVNPPVTEAAEVGKSSQSWAEVPLTTGVTYYAQVIPIDAFGDGTASSVASGVVQDLEYILDQIDGQVTKSILHQALQDEIETITLPYFQLEPPENPRVGDRWRSPADKNRLFKWSGSLWVETSDARMGENHAAIIKEETTRQSENEALAQTTETLWGEVYLETGRLALAKAEALLAAGNAQETADGEVVVFKQAAAPTVGMYFGDIWIRLPVSGLPAASDIFRYEDAAGGSQGVLSWVASPLNAIGLAFLDAIAAQATADANAEDLTTFVDVLYPQDIGDLQTQIDGKVEFYVQETDPQLEWAPADVASHDKDQWYHPINKVLKRFTAATLAWQTIEDAAALAAAQAAADAQGTANSKRRVFVATPTTPYEVGDLWTQGVAGDLMKCKIARAIGSYAASDWEKASKYTDDTLAASKTKIFFTDAANVTSAVTGDMWVRSNGEIWRKLASGSWEVQDVANLAKVTAAIEENNLIRIGYWKNASNVIQTATYEEGLGQPGWSWWPANAFAEASKQVQVIGPDGGLAVLKDVMIATKDEFLGLKAERTIKTEVRTSDGKRVVAGIGLLADETGNSQIIFKAGQVSVVSDSLSSSGEPVVPFYAEGNVVYMKTVVIKEGALVTGKLIANGVTSLDTDVRTTNVSANRTSNGITAVVSNRCEIDIYESLLPVVLFAEVKGSYNLALDYTHSPHTHYIEVKCYVRYNQVTPIRQLFSVYAQIDGSYTSSGSFSTVTPAFVHAATAAGLKYYDIVLEVNVIDLTSPGVASGTITLNSASLVALHTKR